MTPEQLSEAIGDVLTSLVDDGSLRLDGPAVARPPVRVERARRAGHGDYATSIAMQIARGTGTDARALAALVAERLGGRPGVATVEVAGPGFLNVSVDATTQGQVAADVAAAGATYGASPLLAGQRVDLTTDVVPRRWSKRDGTVLTIEDLVRVIGADATRYALARHNSDSSVDLELWARASCDNPAYYVQYTHSRTSSILRNARELGLDPAGADPTLLTHDLEGGLLRALAEHPRVAASAATLRQPQRVARHLEDTAGAFHRFHDGCRVLPRGDEEPGELHRARLLLVDATRTVLANGLGLLGVSAPERM